MSLAFQKSKKYAYYEDKFLLHFYRTRFFKKKRNGQKYFRKLMRFQYRKSFEIH